MNGPPVWVPGRGRAGVDPAFRRLPGRGLPQRGEAGSHGLETVLLPPWSPESALPTCPAGKTGRRFLKETQSQRVGRWHWFCSDAPPRPEPRCRPAPEGLCGRASQLAPALNNQFPAESWGFGCQVLWKPILFGSAKRSHPSLLTLPLAWGHLLKNHS